MYIKKLNLGMLGQTVDFFVMGVTKVVSPPFDGVQFEFYIEEDRTTFLI